MFDRNLMKLDGMGPVMGALVVLALLQAACIIGQALALSSAISLLWEGRGLSVALQPAIAFLACFSLLNLLGFAQDTMLDRTSRAQATRLEGELVAAAFDPDVLLSRAVGTTALTTAATDGLDEIEAYLRLVPPKIVGLAAVTLPVLVCEFAIDWPSGVILAVMLPVIMFFMVLLGRQARAQSERQYAAYTRLNNRFMDTLRGMRTILAFGAQERESGRTFEASERLRKATVRTLTTATLSSAVLDLCATFGVAAVAMMLAFRLMDGSVDLYTGLAALILAPEYFSPIRSFSGDYHASLDGKNALANHLALLELARSFPAAPNAEIVAWTDASTLEFREVGYAYDDKPGVRGLSFTARSGQLVALVGPSGAGKSTLADLLAGFKAPTSGNVLIDGKRTDLRCASWKRHVRYIPQTPYVFRATLEDNLRFYNPEAPRAAVLKAARAVGLEALIDEMPDGLDTLVGDGARGLSGGEAHRVALARVLLDDQARILVFDEPTAHLDIETELELKEPMLKLMQGKLTFIATHRLHWCADADKVISLEAGALADEGGLA